MIYEPQEDSALLAKHVVELAQGNVLDMGTGSGFQARAAALSARVNQVLATDIDAKAIAYARKTHPDPKITYRISDLFRNVTGRFDTIIFNPPYLPAEEGLKDRALVGGKRGYETICRFLTEAPHFLEKKGQILMVYSSLSRPEKIKECAEKLLFEIEDLDQMHQFFEDLFVVRITKKKIRENLEASGFKDLHYFAKGKRGWIFTATLKGSLVAVKIKNPSSFAISTVEHESRMLRRLNKSGIGPLFKTSAEGYVSYAFVKGPFIEEFLEKATAKRITHILFQILDQCRIMDKMGISKEEMTRPIKHIIITKGDNPTKGDKLHKGDKPVMIDFERAHSTHKPHNVTQFCQFLSSAHIRFVLASKKIFIEPPLIIAAGKKYARHPSEKTFKEIKGLMGLQKKP